MEKTTRGNRLHIGIYGRTNVGKSTFLNKVVRQNVSITSEIKGTTTDVVYKPMEFHELGAVVFMDTAGLDDESSLGKERIKKTLQAVDKTDIVVLVTDYNGFSNFEIEFLNGIKKEVIVVISKNDIQKIDDDKLEEIKKYSKNILFTDLNDERIAEKFEKILLNTFQKNYSERTLLDNLVKEKDTAILVVPIDKEAPKGRLILPQVQVLRELLDRNVKTIVLKESELKETLDDMCNNPKLVITDSQAFKYVSEIVPNEIPLTSFSILFANFKGDINAFVKGVKALETLKNGDNILFLESCTHHPVDDDIARVKIPKLIEKKTNKKFNYSYFSGCSMPDDLNQYSLIIHCGACMTNRSEVLSRIEKADKLNIPITNYGITIAYCLGILDRAIKPVI